MERVSCFSWSLTQKLTPLRFSESLPHIPNIRNFEDFLNLVMLMNYAELVLVLTPARYCRPDMFSFSNVIFNLPRQRSREIRSWVVKNFQLILDPPCSDGYTDVNRLECLLLKSLTGQAHTLWHSVKSRRTLGVVGEIVLKDGQEKQITAGPVLSAIRTDLAEFPGFSMGPQDLLKPAPTSYGFPAAPKSSSYALRMKAGLTV